MVHVSQYSNIDCLRVVPEDLVEKVEVGPELVGLVLATTDKAVVHHLASVCREVKGLVNVRE